MVIANVESFEKLENQKKLILSANQFIKNCKSQAATLRGQLNDVKVFTDLSINISDNEALKAILKKIEEC